MDESGPSVPSGTDFSAMGLTSPRGHPELLGPHAATCVTYSYDQMKAKWCSNPRPHLEQPTSGAASFCLGADFQKEAQRKPAIGLP